MKFLTLITFNPDLFHLQMANQVEVGKQRLPKRFTFLIASDLSEAEGKISHGKEEEFVQAEKPVRLG